MAAVRSKRVFSYFFRASILSIKNARGFTRASSYGYTQINKNENQTLPPICSIFNLLPPLKPLSYDAMKYNIITNISLPTLDNTNPKIPKNEYDINGLILEDCTIYIPSTNIENVKTILLPELNKIQEIKLSSVLKKRRKKMNKHKYEKRRKRDKAKRRNVMVIREKKQRRKRAYWKERLIEKLDKIRKSNPKSDIFERPYIIHRLKTW